MTESGHGWRINAMEWVARVPGWLNSGVKRTQWRNLATVDLFPAFAEGR